MFVYTYVLLLSRAWGHVGPQDEIRKRAEDLNLKTGSYFIRARIPERRASNLRKLQGLNPELPQSYIGNWPYLTPDKSRTTRNKLATRSTITKSAHIERPKADTGSDIRAAIAINNNTSIILNKATRPNRRADFIEDEAPATQWRLLVSWLSRNKCT